MNITDLIIIYLACGSPFGVYQITMRQPDRSGVEVLKIVSSFLFWPLYLGDLLIGRIFNSRERADEDRHFRIEEIRQEIECLAFSGESISRLFEFREIFYRFTGLSEAVNATIGRSTNEIFVVTGHDNNSLGSRCLDRRNAKRLAFHQVIARNEFIDLLSQLAIEAAVRADLVALSTTLAEDLQDPEQKAHITSLLLGQPKPAIVPTSVSDNETVRARAQTTSVVNSGSNR